MTISIARCRDLELAYETFGSREGATAPGLGNQQDDRVVRRSAGEGAGVWATVAEPSYRECDRGLANRSRWRTVPRTSSQENSEVPCELDRAA
ncbi:MAG TPA: hypothetical protein VFG87_09765 [Amycolatopsis sp.]|nr:hypothetical protein [Amycolatopsis sp.]